MSRLIKYGRRNNIYGDEKMKYCNRCGKEIVFGREKYLQDFVFCGHCYKAAKFELGYEKEYNPYLGK